VYLVQRALAYRQIVMKEIYLRVSDDRLSRAVRCLLTWRCPNSLSLFWFPAGPKLHLESEVRISVESVP
jgi:hypothetical protein